MLATLFLVPMQSLTSIPPPLPPLCYSLFLIPIVQSQVGGLRLRAAVPSAIYILDIEYKTLNL